jgi:hypothetical protein
MKLLKQLEEYDLLDGEIGFTYDMLYNYRSVRAGTVMNEEQLKMAKDFHINGAHGSIPPVV